MADTIDIQNTNEWLAEVQAAARELVNVLKGGIDVGQTGTLGDLALIDTLADAPVGDAEALRAAIGLANSAIITAGNGNNQLMIGSEYPDNVDPSAVKHNGIFSFSKGNTSGLPVDTNGEMLVAMNNNGTFGNAIILYHGSVPGIYIRSIRGEEWQSSFEILHRGLVTVDGNGFIKESSPIFRLANVAEYAAGDGFTLDGCGAYNGEAEGVTASHDEVGVYTVSGSLGFSADGWTIEIPQDVNGNRLCFVETETADDGTITVRTFGRRFDYETAMIVAGDPIDIPDGRWIDLRLKMPEPEVVDEPDDSTEQEPAQ
ncbi:hypothetical protein [Salinicola salarius]|uniref:phage tail fiber protein n=1 Tax=Salinicola salarius TaxID=430457 RepID=UPI000DA1719D|nr:hypothetical protein [Salinicola salarius]